MIKPVIAAINGYAVGGGCELSSCLRYKDRKGGMRNSVSLKLTLALSRDLERTQRLTKTGGIGRAKELILTGRIIDAKEAEAIGLGQ